MPDQQTLKLTKASPQRGKTCAPEELTPQQLKAIHAWADLKVPWISRGAFSSLTTVEEYVDETLEWWGADGRKKKNWPKTIQNRIRQRERSRLERLANAGNENAKLALRQPEEWARRFDRYKSQAAGAVSSGHGDLISPRGGNVIRIAPNEGPEAEF